MLPSARAQDAASPPDPAPAPEVTATTGAPEPSGDAEVIPRAAGVDEVKIVIFSPGLAVDDEDAARFVVDPYVEYMNKERARKHSYEVFFKQAPLEEYLKSTTPHFGVFDTLYFLEHYKDLGLDVMFQAEDEDGSSVQRFSFFTYGDSKIASIKDIVGQKVSVPGFTHRSLGYLWSVLFDETPEAGLVAFDQIDFAVESLPEDALNAMIATKAVAGVSTEVNLAVLREMFPEHSEKMKVFYQTRQVPSYAVLAAFRKTCTPDLIVEYRGELGRMHKVPPGQFTLVVLGAHHLAPVASIEELLDRIGRPEWAVRAVARQQ